MQHLFLYAMLLGLSLNFMACSTTKTETIIEVYLEVPKDKSLKSYVGQKIWLEGTISTNIRQHMMKGSNKLDANPEKHIYIDYHEDGQIVGYYRGFEAPKDKDKTYKFYGIVNKMSGAGKGGGTHTEYYINLDKIE